MIRTFLSRLQGRRNRGGKIPPVRVAPPKSATNLSRRIMSTTSNPDIEFKKKKK